MSIVYKSDLQRGREWQRIFSDQLPEVPFYLWPDIRDPEAVEYLVAWQPPENLLQMFPNLQVVFSVGAGIDQFDLREFPARIKVVRMIDDGITQGVVEYVTLATLALHREMPAYLEQQRQQRWQAREWTPAQQRRVGVMGLGNLGKAVIGQLRTLGFQLRGWARSSHVIEGVECFAGSEELPDFLAGTDILICLLPLTDETKHILRAETLALMPRGASVVNAGRGGHVEEEDLLAALDAGQISSAFLDVAEREPLPAEHSFWRHPGIILTPHVAGVTRTDSAWRQLLDNVRRHRAGKPMVGEIDSAAGY